MSRNDHGREAAPGGAASSASMKAVKAASERADLHVHTTASDGTLTPAELVAAALAAGLRAVGICDHDTIDGVEPARLAAGGTELDVVPGVEINTSWSGGEVHVLGYCYRAEDSALTSLLSRMREERQNRVQRMVEKLAKGGYAVSLQRVRELAGEGAIGRPHVARALVEAGIASSERDAFDRFLTPGRPGYVARYKLSPEEAVKAILAAGGVPVLAHPGLIGEGSDDLIAALAEAGLVGLEAYHADHAPGQVEHYLAAARRYSLLVTGGSDYHGPGRGHETELGAATVSYEVVELLRSRARESGATP